MASPAPRRIQVPDGLKEILQDFVVSVLRNQVPPDNIRNYAAQYFADQVGMRLVSGNTTSQQAQHTDSLVAGSPSAPGGGNSGGGGGSRPPADKAKPSIPDDSMKKSPSKADMQPRPPATPQPQKQQVAKPTSDSDKPRSSGAAAAQSASAAMEEGENVYREENGLGAPPPTEGYTADPTAPMNKVAAAGKPPSGDEAKQPAAAADGNANDDDEESADRMPGMTQSHFKPPARGKARRQSVSAESYDPSKDDGEAEKNLPIFPKTDVEMATLRDAMKNALIFRSLDPNQLAKVADAVRPVTFEAGATVIKEGDENANDFYVIENGVLDIFKTINGEEKFMGKYENSGAFGELALLYNQPRAATIKCKTNAKLWALDRQTFQVIVVRAAYKKRQLYMEIMDKVDFLSELTSFEKQNVCDALRPKYFPTPDGNTVIMRQGDQADGMYFIEEGTCRIYVSGDKGDSAEGAQKGGGEEQEISTLTRGMYFGELALITKRPRAATVKADGKVKLAFLDTGAFERLCGPCTDVMRRNIDKYEKQLNEHGIQIKLQ